MTLANFNSNFNWQYRMLKEAAECCGIVPDLPPAINCYCYTISPGSGAGVCKIVYKNCEGLYEATTSSKTDPVYICAQEGSIILDCPVGTTVVVTGGSVICTGIPGECIPLVVDCYWYAKVHDPACISFNPGVSNWTLNGVDFSSGWYTLMVNPPYGAVGSGVQYTDNLSGCGSYSYADYYLWTVVPSTVLTLPDLTGNDSNGDPVSVRMLGPICATKCYEGTFRSPFGSFFVMGITTAEVNATDFSIAVNLTTPFASGDFTYQLGQFYPSPPLNVTVTVLGPDEYTIRIDGLYSLGNVVYVYMDDAVTIGELFEVPC